MRPVAALYVDRRGAYAHMTGVDPWFLDGRPEGQGRLAFEERFHFYRDATEYDGPHPVVAHPPCGPWGHLSHLSRFQDRALALRAVEQVRRFGGVLEHPSRSKLWGAAGLPLPGASVGDGHGYAIEIEQVSWGHVARKATWLYLVGVPRQLVNDTIRTGGTPTHWISAFRERPGGRKHRGGAAPEGIKICSAEQRRRTPPAFAAWLVSLARAVDMSATAAIAS